MAAEEAIDLCRGVADWVGHDAKKVPDGAHYPCSDEPEKVDKVENNDHHDEGEQYGRDEDGKTQAASYPGVSNFAESLLEKSRRGFDGLDKGCGLITILSPRQGLQAVNVKLDGCREALE